MCDFPTSSKNRKVVGCFAPQSANGMRDTMKMRVGLVMFAFALLAGLISTPAQQSNSQVAPTLASIMEVQLGVVEGQFVPVAEAMPADKYNFAPGNGNGQYSGVRTFALEVRHVATANFGFYSLILGQAPPPGVSLAGAANGPDDLKTKEQIVKYLKDSFALGHKAFASLTQENALTPIPNPPFSAINTRLSAATLSLWHAMDHYGQMVEYLRMNRIVPPPSQGQPPANPPKN
jgi:hypothetical protein